MQKFEVFFEPIALAIMLVYLYGMVHRSGRSLWVKQISMGLIFGFAAAVSMNVPITLSDGIILDLRNLFVGIAAGFFGLRAGLITLSIAIVVRLNIGGDGVIYALPAMCIVTIMGLTWRRYFWRNGNFKRAALPILGAMIATHLSVGIFLPSHLLTKYFLTIVPLITAMHIVGAYVLGRLLQRETAFLDHAEKLKIAATIDPLTSLINRRELEAVVASMPQEKAKSGGRAILFFDIDNFKDINDTYGHAAGDEALVELSRRINKCLRPTDIFARMGGDEFVIILPGTSNTEAKIVAERCRNAISRGKFEGAGHSFDVSISLGVKWAEASHAFTADLARADAALFRAKSMGRNCVVYDTGTEDQHAETLDYPASA